jgi:hypothetical protein
MAGSEAFELRVSGKLLVTPIQVNGATVELSTRLDEAHAEGRGDEGHGNSEALAKEIGQPNFVTLSSGRFTESHMTKEMSAIAASFQRTIAAALQLVPPTNGADTWKSFEQDATGQYEIEYRTLPEPRQLARHKLRYATLLASKVQLPVGIGIGIAGGALDSSIEVIASDGTVKLDAAHRLAALDYGEELRAKIMVQAPLTSKTTLSLTLEKTEPDTVTKGWENFSGRLVRVSADEMYAAPAPPVNLDAARAAGMSFEQALAQMLEIDQEWQPPTVDHTSAAGDDKARLRAQQMSRVFLAMGVALRQDPANVRRVVALVRSGSRSANALIESLASSSASASQPALVELIADARLKPELRKAAAASLIRTDQPSDATVQFVTKLVNDKLLTEYGVYGLGTFARKIRETDVARSDQISKFLVNRLTSTRDSFEKITALRGIANSAYVGALEAVKVHLNSEDALVRSAAVEALRLMQHPDVDPLVANKMADKRPNVRNAALETAAYRPLSETSLAAVIKMAMTTSDAYGRMEAVKVLATWLEQRKELRTVLEQVVQKDPEPRIREVAQRALKS